MAEPVDLATIRRDAFLRALHQAANNPSATVVAVHSLVQALSLPAGLLRFVIDPLVSEDLITIEGGLDSGTVLLTDKGILEANEVVNRRHPSRAKTKILCVDTEPETGQRLKNAGYMVFEVSMGYRTGKRNFSFPPPNEMNLIVCDLKRPACFDSKDWGPSGSNDNYRCRIIRHEEVDTTFSAVNSRRLARHRVVYETQLGKPIPGTFGPKEVNRAIAEGGVPFLLFLNEEWLARIQEFPNWLDVKWSFLPTAATEVEIAEPLPTLLPEVGREIKLKLALQHRIEKGPLFGQTSPRFPTVANAIVSNNIGDIFGQFVRMGKGGVWLLPATHQNADVLELLAHRVETMRQLSSDKPATGNMHQRQVQLDARLNIPGSGEFDHDLLAFCAKASIEKPLSLIIVDIDHFKGVNDQYGHEVGNDVLKQVSGTLTAGCQGKGTVYRYGGDEITILIQNYSLPEAEVLAERLRLQVARVRTAHNPPVVTASIGVTTFPEPVTDATSRSWPGEKAPCVVPDTKPVQPTSLEVAEAACRRVADANRRADCIFDVKVTGHTGFATTYLVTQRILKDSTAVRLTDDPDPSQLGESVTFTTFVTANDPEAIGHPVGTVQFAVDGMNMGAPVPLDAKGRATWQTTGLKVGKHQVTASYFPGADSVFLPSTSVAQVHVVKRCHCDEAEAKRK